MRIELIPAAPEQAPVIANLLELYAHDFSEFLPLELGEDGRFGYKALPLYWNDPGRYPFLIKVEEKLAGLALVKKTQNATAEVVWDIAEFFIVRAYRRNGIGTQAAHELWRRFPGPWEVRVMQANRRGVEFWQCAIATFSNGEAVVPASVDKDGKRWYVFSFEC